MFVDLYRAALVKDWDLKDFENTRRFGDYNEYTSTSRVSLQYTNGKWMVVEAKKSRHGHTGAVSLFCDPGPSSVCYGVSKAGRGCTYISPAIWHHPCYLEIPNAGRTCVCITTAVLGSWRCKGVTATPLLELKNDPKQVPSLF